MTKEGAKKNVCSEIKAVGRPGNLTPIQRWANRQQNTKETTVSTKTLGEGKRLQNQRQARKPSSIVS